jgi:membrane protein required for colicin V production
MMGLSILDWVLLLIVLLSVLQATAQGFFYEAFALAGAVVGYLVAAWEYPRVAAWYAHYVNSQWVADIAGFLTVFFVIVLLAGVAGRIARWAVSGVGLRWFDRLLGGVFGFLRGAAVATVIVMALAAFTPQSPRLQQSRFAPFLLVTGRALIWAAPPDLRQRFRDGWNLLRTVPEHVTNPLSGHGDAK